MKGTLLTPEEQAEIDADMEETAEDIINGMMDDLDDTLEDKT